MGYLTGRGMMNTEAGTVRPGPQERKKRTKKKKKRQEKKKGGDMALGSSGHWTVASAALWQLPRTCTKLGLDKSTLNVMLFN